MLPLNQTSTGGAPPADPATADPNARGLGAEAVAPCSRPRSRASGSGSKRCRRICGSHAFDLARWDAELAADLRPLFHGIDPDAAAPRAIALAERINTDTLRRLVDGVADPFAGRGATYE